MKQANPSKVYFTDFRTAAFGDGLPAKLKKLMKKADIGSIDMEGKCILGSWVISAFFVLTMPVP